VTLVRAVRDEVAAHAPVGARERWSRSRTLALLDWLPSPLDGDRDPWHVTGSAIVLDAVGRVLLHRHKRLGIWLQPGGHLDAGESPAQAAVREPLEESGLVGSHPAGGPHLLHVDVHEGPRGHVHLDLRYLLYADGEATIAPAPGESADVAWMSLEEATRVADTSLADAIEAARRQRGGPPAQALTSRISDAGRRRPRR
jgi:8-oxo-dGTP pyrophosphatase MutT (NUDIX family)